VRLTDWGQECDQVEALPYHPGACEPTQPFVMPAFSAFMFATEPHAEVSR
jgi:hypothetical protein